MINGKIQKLPSVRRLPTYLHKLMEMEKKGIALVSTTVLAEYMDTEPIGVRKDLEITGITGQPGVGYKTAELIAAIRGFLGWDNNYEAVLAGAGSLGRALMGYEGFEHYGLQIVAAFDSDPEKIGNYIFNRKIHDVRVLPEFCIEKKMHLGIICVPAAHAQPVADLMVDGGIKAIWSFANVALKVPEDVIVQREVIAGGLAVLSVKLAQRLSSELELTGTNEKQEIRR